eukprot:scaffold58652_cov57-Phaeocystis_antarctica.AAC.2
MQLNNRHLGEQVLHRFAPSLRVDLQVLYEEAILYTECTLASQRCLLVGLLLKLTELSLCRSLVLEFLLLRECLVMDSILPVLAFNTVLELAICVPEVRHPNKFAIRPLALVRPFRSRCWDPKSTALRAGVQRPAALASAAHGVANLLVVGLNDGQVAHDNDLSALHVVAPEPVEPDDAELLQLPRQHPARTITFAFCVASGPRRRQGWRGRGGPPRACPESIIELRPSNSMACICRCPSESTRR